MSVEEPIKFEYELKNAEENFEAFLLKTGKNYNNDKLSSLFGYFLANSENLTFLKEVIKKTGSLKNEKNLDDLIDFLMSRTFDKKTDLNEIINLKVLCIKAISNYKDKKCIPALLYCLNNKTANYKIRFQAAVALGKIGDKNAVESLINVVSDENEKSVYVRESAAEALGMIGDMRAIDPFLSILEAKKAFFNKFAFLKERIIESLGKINFSGNEKRVLHAFKNALEDSSPQVRINAVECLMNSDSEEAYDLIKSKLNDGNEEVVKNVVIALYNLRGKEALFEILKDENSGTAAKKEADEIYMEYEEGENE